MQKTPQKIPKNTRIKVCGFTRPDDVLAAVEAGVDAFGFVFYPPSPRYVHPEQAAELVALLPPFVQAVGLFVNATDHEIAHTLATVPLHVLQFHGDESPAACQTWQRPWLRAARVRPGLDLLQYAAAYAAAPGFQGVLLDAFVEGYGGGGHVFDWRLIPEGLSAPLILSGGLHPENVTAAVQQVRPCAVDVSSGVEASKGIKDHAKIRAFVAAVRAADAS